MGDLDAHVEGDLNTEESQDDGAIEGGVAPVKGPGVRRVIDWSRVPKREQAGETDEENSAAVGYEDNVDEVLCDTEA